MEGDFTVTYENNKYNIKTFLETHPGGKEVLLEFKDKDITAAFKDVNHSDTARELLEKYKVNAEMKEKKVRRKVTLKFVMEKLITKEDNFMFHKFFGLLSLVSFLYRYALLVIYGNMGFDGDFYDYLTLGAHFMLSSSSLIFHVLKTRLVKNPLIIYEEYRLHAILFTARSVAVSIIGMTMQSFFSPELRQLVLVASILTVHLLVDWVTMRHGTPGVTAVRNGNAQDLRVTKMFFAYYQFTALGSHLIFNERLGDLGFNTLIAIQISAFLMTLKRKSIIPWTAYIIIYGGALLLSMWCMFLAKGAIFFPIVLFFFYLRTNFSLNKYIVWSLFLLTYFAISSPLSSVVDTTSLLSFTPPYISSIRSLLINLVKF